MQSALGVQAALMPLFWLIRQERGCQTQAEPSPRAFWRMGTEPDRVDFLWISLVGKTPWVSWSKRISQRCGCTPELRPSAVS